MERTALELVEPYTSDLRSYLAEGGEAPLKRAYELGRKAVADGLGVLELTTVHYRALSAILRDAPISSGVQEAILRSREFFAEALSPFEMALRGFQEVNAGLRASLDELAAFQEELRRQNQTLRQAQHVIDMERQRYRELFDFAPDAYLVTDLEGNIQEANSAAGTLLGKGSSSLARSLLVDFVAGEDHKRFVEQLAGLHRGQTEKVEDWQITMRGSAIFPAEVTVGVVWDARGEPTGLRWLVRDTTERKRAEEERTILLARERSARAEAEAARRLKFLAEASTVLAASLDFDSTLTSVARLSVPYLADFCSIDVVEEDGEIRRVAAEHADPAMSGLLLELRKRHPPNTQLAHAASNVLRSGHSELYTEIPPSPVESAARDTDHLRLLRELNLGSAMIVPLLARERVLGAISLACSVSGRRYAPADLELAEDLGRRCAFAVDNARLYQQVIVERDKVEKSSLAKDEFVALLSHELRNPLMPILGWSRILKNQPAITGNKVLYEGVRCLERNARNIARLVEDCLDLARITVRKISLEKDLADLNEIASASVESVMEECRVKGLDLRLKLSPSPLWLLGDRTRLEQVVMNLLTNAIKFTGSGGSVSVDSRNMGDEAEIQVTDTGIGIAPDSQERIFEPFNQGSRETWLTSDSGLGLGLAIAREIVQLHGGRIWAESEGIGKGSRFFIRVPLISAKAMPGDLGLEPARAASAIRRLRVLVIEDKEDVLSLMKMELEGLDYSVLCARDGTSGLQLAKDERPDVIVSDVKMPGIDGYELIRRIKSIPELAGIPAVALTGFGMEKDVKAALGAGYDAHVTKPIDPKKLSDLLQKLAAERT